MIKYMNELFLCTKYKIDSINNIYLKEYEDILSLLSKLNWSLSDKKEHTEDFYFDVQLPCGNIRFNVLIYERTK